MSRRAKLSLSPEAVDTGKETPHLDAARVRARADAPRRTVRPRRGAPVLDARRIGQLALVAAIGALSIYLVARRVTRHP